MGIDLTSFFIYRFRYWVGYGLVALLLIALLVFAGLYTPGGLSQIEMDSVVQSSELSITAINSFGVTNAPFYLLQNASINIFGISNFSIKLPSLILAFISAVGLILLLRRWFTANIAVLTSIIAITTGQFLFIAQSGSPRILYLLWPVWLLLLATLIAKRVRFSLLWKFAFFIVAALSLYTPLSIYVIIALIISAILHPHLRFIIRKLSKVRLIGALIVGLILTVPLVLGIIATPQLGLQLLGFPEEPTSVITNIQVLYQQYLAFAVPSTTLLMTPVFSLGSMLIIGFGVYKLIRSRASTQSYLMMIWIACLIPFIVINPQFTSVTFLPLVLLLATGLTSLLGFWYTLFPKNPYARIVGLIPLIVLVSVLVLSGQERYFYGYHYDPETSANFSKDLTLLPKDTKQLVVSDEQAPFYQVVASHRPGLTVAISPSTADFTVTRDAKSVFDGYEITRIVTTSARDEADRFYVYKKLAQ